MSVTSGELSEQPSGHPVILLCPSTKSSLFEPRRLTLDDDSLTVKIGRAVAKQRAEPGNAIFDCRVLSRDHGSIYYKDAGFFIVDAGSANGTFVNGRRLSPSTQASKPEPLYSGDLLQLGVEVVDSTKQVTHNSIVARVQLFHPDGTEAVRPPEQPFRTRLCVQHRQLRGHLPSEVANAGATAAIAQCLAESLRRERRLDERLSELNRVFSDLSSTVAGVSLDAPVVCDEAMLSRLERLLDQVQEPEQPGQQQQQTQTDGPLAQQLEYYIEQRSTLDASDGRQSKADSNPEDFSQDADTSAGVAFTAEGSLHGSSRGSMAEGSVTGLVGEQDKSKPVEQRMLFLPIQCQRQDEHSDSEQPAELLNVFNEVYFQDISSDNEQPTRLYEESDAQKSESGKEQMQLLDSSLLQNYQAQLDEQRQALQEQHENQLKQQLAELQEKHRQEQKALEEDYQQLSRKDKELQLQLFEQKERENALLEEQAKLKKDLLSLSQQQKLPMQEQQAQDQACRAVAEPRTAEAAVTAATTGARRAAPNAIKATGEGYEREAPG
uniref:FHA domain-containing protein n=1 Tax=Macrostomum lignano TaxID=282301 RepID=A0A1I8JI74_9PLAT